MTTIGYAALDIIPSLKNVRSELERQTAVPASQAGKAAGARFGDAAGREAGDTFRGRFSGALRGLAGLGLGVGVVSLFRSAITEASNAEQAIGGVNAVFGEYARQVTTASEDAADALGLSATAYQQLVTVSGALLKNKGLEDYAAQSQNLLQIGADLAAQYGGPTTQAVEALNSALRGESDPIERYAISLNEAAVNAKLAAEGQDRLTGAALDQAKTAARLALIQEQSADAAGAFAREQDTAAGAAQSLTAEWANMRRELGEELLPAAAGFVGFLRDDGLPALRTTGEAVGGVVDVMGKIPAPVYGAAAAFTALKVAASFGAGDAARTGISRLSDATDTLRIRTMLAADAYRTARSGTLNLQGAYGTLTPAAGRLTSSMRALGTVTAGTGAALRRGLGGVVSLLGGPWGIALTVGAVGLTKFYQSQQEAKARVEELTASLDEQTGALTEQSRQGIFKALQDSGAIEAAHDFGISLESVRLAAEGNEGALRRVLSQLDAYIAAQPQVTSETRDGAQAYQNMLDTADKLRGALSGQNEEVRAAGEAFRDEAEFMGAAEGATDALAESTRGYKTDLDKTTGALRRLAQAENERRLDNIQNRRDQIALRETLRAAREEANKGRQVLNGNTKAADANMTALLDLADQWNNSIPKVRNAQGAFENIRGEFIKLADQMNGPDGTRKDAIKLADSLLSLPKNVPIRFRSEGFQERMRELRELRAAAENLQVQLDYQNLVKAAGPGGNPGAQTPNQRTAPNVTVNVDKVYANNSNDILKGAQRRGLGGFN